MPVISIKFAGYRAEYSHKKSESLAQIHTTMTEIQHFLGDCFLLAHPVDARINSTLQCIPDIFACLDRWMSLLLTDNVLDCPMG